MSNEALTWAFAQSTGNPARKAVLLALADMADEARSCFPHQSTLARMTDQSERSVRAHLAELERVGLVNREHRYRDGKRIGDRYVLPVSVVVGMHKPAADLPARSAGSQPENLASRQPVLPADSVVPTGKSRRALTLKNPKTPSVSQPRATKGTRLDPSWLRTDGDKAWQAERGIPDEFAREATAEFRDHFAAATGRTATKLDWSAAWRNWMRRAWRERHGETYRRTHGQPVRVVDFDAEREKAKLERARQRFASTDGLASAR